MVSEERLNSMLVLLVRMRLDFLDMNKVQVEILKEMKSLRLDPALEQIQENIQDLKRGQEETQEMLSRILSEI